LANFLLPGVAAQLGLGRVVARAPVRMEHGQQFAAFMIDMGENGHRQAAIGNALLADVTDDDGRIPGVLELNEDRNRSAGQTGAAAERTIC